MLARIRKTAAVVTATTLALGSTFVGTAFLAGFVEGIKGEKTVAETKVEQKAVVQPTSTATPISKTTESIVDGQIVHTGYDYQDLYNGIITESKHTVSIEYTNTKPISPIHKIVKFNLKTAKAEEITTQDGKTYTSDSVFTHWVERVGENAVLHINSTEDDGTLVKANAYVITWKSSRPEEGVKGYPLQALKRFEGYDFDTHHIKVEGELTNCSGFTNVPVAINPQFGKFDLDGDGVACDGEQPVAAEAKQEFVGSHKTSRKIKVDYQEIGEKTVVVHTNDGRLNCRAIPQGEIVRKYPQNMELTVNAQSDDNWYRTTDGCWVSEKHVVEAIQATSGYTPEEAQLEASIDQSVPVVDETQSYTSSGSGRCDTPDQVDSRGRRCGGRAASVRSGGRRRR